MLLRRRDRLAGVLGRLCGQLEAVHAGTRLVLAQHPAKPQWDAFWIVAAAWSTGARCRRIPTSSPPAPPTPCAPPAAGARRLGWRPDEIAEARIVGLWLAAHEARVHELTPGTDPGVLAERLSGP